MPCEEPRRDTTQRDQAIAAQKALSEHHQRVEVIFEDLMRGGIDKREAQRRYLAEQRAWSERLPPR